MIKRCMQLLLMLVMAMSNCLAADAAADPATGEESAAHRFLVMLRLPPPHFRPGAGYSGGYTGDAGRSTRRRIAEELARTHGLTLIADWPMPALSIDCYVMEEPRSVPSSRTIDLLSKDPRVEWVQPVAEFHAMGSNDPLYAAQPSAKYWHLAELHKAATGRNVLVAVVDSGIDEKHPDLTGQVVVKENFIDGNPYAPETHGTGVAGIIAARADNGIGIEGVAPGARLMALRACWQRPDQTTRCDSFTLGKALNFAIMHNAQIINLSLSGPPDRLLQQLIDVALARGIKVVGAVDPLRTDGGFPASCPGVLAVTDDESRGTAAGILIAPGRDIPTTTVGAKWHFVSGSSYATAHVSGMVAMLSELRPALKPSELRAEMVANSAGSLDARTAGSINPCATIARASAKCACFCPTVQASKAAHYP